MCFHYVFVTPKKNVFNCVFIPRHSTKEKQMYCKCYAVNILYTRPIRPLTQLTFHSSTVSSEENVTIIFHEELKIINNKLINKCIFIAAQELL